VAHRGSSNQDRDSVTTVTTVNTPSQDDPLTSLRKKAVNYFIIAICVIGLLYAAVAVVGMLNERALKAAHEIEGTR
jgi:hypothetical protein